MRLVMIEWVDSHVGLPGWKQLGDVDYSEAPIVRSVGWLHIDGDDLKVVIPHWIKEQGAVADQGCGEMAIPARAIIRIINLRE